MICFEKMQALGNDFIFIKESECENRNYSELALRLCDRHKGIGADGLVLVKKDPLEMKIYNQDGSEAKMCGNAMRCFVSLIKKWHWDHEGFFEILCHNERYICRKEKDENQVFFPHVSFDVAEFLVDEKEWIDQKLNVYGVLIPCSIIKSGCCHAVVFDEMNLYKPFASDISNHLLFKDGCNVDFVRVISKNEIEVITYERGVGMTLSCGSGNVASAYAAWRSHQIDPVVKVKNKGGACTVQIEDKGVWLCGECQNVYGGMIDLNGELKNEK